MPDDYHHIAGWDIGGAHVKLAFVKHDLLCVHQWDCPLWKGIEELVSVLTTAIKHIPDSILKHHVTMTGELVDIFVTHDEGVEQIIKTFVQSVTSQDKALFYSNKGLLTFEQALENTASVASANWMASAESVGECINNAIFIDVGSTTTDILHINGSGLVINGLTDFDRLITGELVYTGVVRSCVNTLCREIPYQDQWVPLMAECFSTAADVYRILEWLPASADYGATMDGKAKDKISSMRRLARMVGKDYIPEDEAEWGKACEYIAGQQMLMIEKSIMSILQANPSVKHIVGAGVGTFIIKHIAERLILEYRDFAQFIIPGHISYQDSASDCAPAVALVFIDSICE